MPRCHARPSFELRTLPALLLSVSLPLAALAADPAPVDSREGLVVTAQHLASDVGAGVLRQGGNAVDAAVAVGYALAVVYPQAGNLGGGGFMTLRLADGRTTFIDFREKAPLAATEKMFQDKDGKVSDLQNLQLSSSDVVSYHSYSALPKATKQVEALERFHRSLAHRPPSGLRGSAVFRSAP